MKSVTIIRYGSIPKIGTFGKLQTDSFSCVTLEREWLHNEPYVSCIYPGQYICSLVNSPKFGRVYEVKNVVARSHILIHPANIQLDLQGCIALGKEFCSLSTPKTGGMVVWGINNSKSTVKAFMDHMNGEDFMLSIEKEV